MQVQQKSLHAALKRIQKAVPPKPTLYSLSNVHLQSNGTGLHLRATDLELDMSTTIQSEGTLDVLIPYKSLLDTVASLSGTIDIEHVGRELRIRSGRSTIEMSTKLVEDFPPRPEVTDGDSFTMTLKDLQKAVNDLSYAVAKNDDRPILTGIRLDVQSSEVKMAVADGFRLAVHTTSCSADEVPILAVIPSRSLVAVSQSFPGPDVHFTISGNKSVVTMVSGDTTARIRLFQGTFPNYTQLVPDKKSATCTVQFQVDDMLKAVNAVEKMARDGGDIVRLHVVSDSIDSGGSHIQVSARADELGTRTEEVPANVSVLQDSKIAFNYRYLLDMFKAHKGKTMTMGIITPSSPGRFDVEDCTSVVMPMHIQW